MLIFSSKLDVNILGAEPHTLLLTPRYIPSSQHSGSLGQHREVMRCSWSPCPSLLICQGAQVGLIQNSIVESNCTCFPRGGVLSSTSPILSVQPSQPLPPALSAWTSSLWQVYLPHLIYFSVEISAPNSSHCKGKLQAVSQVTGCSCTQPSIWRPPSHSRSLQNSQRQLPNTAAKNVAD